MAMSGNAPVKWFLVIDGEAGDLMTVLKATRSGREFRVHRSVGGNNRPGSAAESIQVLVMAVLVSGGQEHRVGANQNIDTMPMMAPFRVFIRLPRRWLRVKLDTCSFRPPVLVFMLWRRRFSTTSNRTMSLWPANLIVTERNLLSNSVNDLAVLGQSTALPVEAALHVHHHGVFTKRTISPRLQQNQHRFHETRC